MNALVGRVLTASAILAAAWPSAARAHEDAHPPPPPPGPTRDVITYEEKTPNGALISSGVTMFGLAYGGSLLVAATSDRPGDANLYIPVAGPWLDLTNRGQCTGLDCGMNETGNRILLVASGLLQAAGAAQILGGFLFPETRTVTRTAGVHVAPTAGKGAIGIAAYGAF